MIKTKNLVIRYSFTLFVFFAFLQIQAQPADTNATDASGKKQGVWISRYEDGTLKQTGQFNKDIPVGEFKYYYPNGRLKAVMEFRPGGQVAFAKIFFDSEENTLMAEGKYIDQKKDSLWVYYFPSGKISTRESYLNDQRHGQSEVFYEEGGISEQANYEKGVKSGPWKQYFPNGKPKMEATVVEGLKYEGPFVEYYPDGSKKVKGEYLDGKKNGSWWHFNEDGSPEIIYLYSNGKILEEHPQNGTFKEYFADDLLKSEYTYKEGKKHGPFKEYYHKGDWITETAVDQFGNERQVQRLHNTQVKREGSYFQGELTGTVTYYSEEGKVEKTEIYEQGELIR